MKKRIDYYPFGLTFNSYSRENTTPQNRKFNGKEEQKTLGLSWLDYGARMYMPEIGRWGVIDPMAAKYPGWSPYNFSFNNPVRFIDPDGRDPVDTNPDKKANRLARKLQKQITKINTMAKSMSAGGFTASEAGKIKNAIAKAGVTVEKLNTRLDKSVSTATGRPAADRVQLVGGFDSKSATFHRDFANEGGQQFVSMKELGIPSGNVHVTSSTVSLTAKSEIKVDASDNVRIIAGEYVVSNPHNVLSVADVRTSAPLTGPLSPASLNSNPSNLNSPFAGLNISSPSGSGSVSGAVTVSYFQFVDTSGTPPIQQ
ncbi:MAG TPA: RHS repeat-associated core domain-containing protein [Chryseosolibacter sp.]